MNLLLTSFWGNIMCPYLCRMIFYHKIFSILVAHQNIPFLFAIRFPCAPRAPTIVRWQLCEEGIPPLPEEKCVLLVSPTRPISLHYSLWIDHWHTIIPVRRNHKIPFLSIHLNTSCRWTYYWLPSEGICAPIICRNDFLSRNFVIPFAHQNIPFRFVIRFLCPKMKWEWW